MSKNSSLIDQGTQFTHHLALLIESNQVKSKHSSPHSLLNALTLDFPSQNHSSSHTTTTKLIPNHHLPPLLLLLFHLLQLHTHNNLPRDDQPTMIDHPLLKLLIELCLLILIQMTQIEVKVLIIVFEYSRSGQIVYFLMDMSIFLFILEKFSTGSSSIEFFKTTFLMQSTASSLPKNRLPSLMVIITYLPNFIVLLAFGLRNWGGCYYWVLLLFFRRAVRGVALFGIFLHILFPICGFSRPDIFRLIEPVFKPLRLILVTLEAHDWT